MCLSACIIYSGIIADTLTSLGTAMGVAAMFNQRWSNLLVITTTALLPLCLLRSLAALGFTSVLGFGAVVYTALFIVLRAVDGTYAVDGIFYNALQAEGRANVLPHFNTPTNWGVSPKAFVLSANLGLAYIAHYNAPRYYNELQVHSPSITTELTLKTFVARDIFHSKATYFTQKRPISLKRYDAIMNCRPAVPLSRT